MLKAVGNANLLVAIGDFDIFLVENRHFFYLRFKRSAWLLRSFLCENYGRRWRFLDAMALFKNVNQKCADFDQKWSKSPLCDPIGQELRFENPEN